MVHEGGSIQFFRVNAKFEHKLRRHKQTLGKIDTTVDESKICYDQGCNDIGVVIASKSRHYLFYFSNIKNFRRWEPYKIVYRSSFRQYGLFGV